MEDRKRSSLTSQKQTGDYTNSETSHGQPSLETKAPKKSFVALLTNALWKWSWENRRITCNWPAGCEETNGSLSAPTSGVGHTPAVATV